MASHDKRIPAVNALNGMALIANFKRASPLPVKAENKSVCSAQLDNLP